MPLKDAKKTAERPSRTARPSPEEALALVRPREPDRLRFQDDGLVPNHPRWPALHYRDAVRLDGAFDPAALFEVLFTRHGWRQNWRDSIYDWLHYHSNQHEVLGIARGRATLRLGGAKGRTVRVKAGDVLILPAGTGHQRLSMSADLLVVGGYPRKGAYDLRRPTRTDHDRSLRAIARVPPPRQDPVYGANGPLTRYWQAQEEPMARKYAKATAKKVERAIHEMKRGKLKSGGSGKTVRSRKQAIAIGLSEARAEGKKAPARPASDRKKTSKKKAS